jgi:hypothetical protein
VRAGTLAGSSAEELTYIYLAAPVFALCVPWGYVVRHFVMIQKRMPKPADTPRAGAPAARYGSRI